MHKTSFRDPQQVAIHLNAPCDREISACHSLSGHFPIRRLHNKFLVLSPDITRTSLYAQLPFRKRNTGALKALRFILKIELPYVPAISLLGIYLEKTLIRKYACTPMCIAALFTVAKTWQQPKHPLKDEWIKKMWHVYTMEY